MKTSYRYIIIALLTLLTAYFSIEIKALDEVKKQAATQFDAKAYARDFLDKKLPPVLPQALSVQDLLSKLNQNKDETFEKYAHAVSIGNLRNFLVQGEAQVSAIEENQVLLQIKNTDGSNVNVQLATEFIYGNAIRDAAGLFDIKQFSNTNDINSIAAEINRIIRSEVVPPFREKLKVGDPVRFTGALELNQAHLRLDKLEILPITLQRL